MSIKNRKIVLSRKPADLAKIALGIEQIMRQENLAVNPRAEMTYLEAHISRTEDIYEALYAEADEVSNEDPLDKIEREEEQVILYSGRNYAGRIL